MTYSNENFENLGNDLYEGFKSKFLKLLHEIRWDDEEARNDFIHYFIEEVIPIPNDPFSEILIELLEWDYGTLNIDIENILEKVEGIRQFFLKETRRVYYKYQYYNFMFVTRNKYIKKLIVYNNEHEVCYIAKYKPHLKFKYLIKSKFASSPEEKECFEKKYLGLELKDAIKKDIGMPNYSLIINVDTEDLDEYFNFFVDFYAKKKFREYLHDYISNRQNLDSEEGIIVHDFLVDESKDFDISHLNNAQIVLLVYFFLKEFGIEPRVNTYVSVLVRWIHIMKRKKFTKVKNSIFYKLALKAPNLKEDSYLIEDLEVVRLELKRVNFSLLEVEREIRIVKRRLEDAS